MNGPAGIARESPYFPVVQDATPVTIPRLDEDPGQTAQAGGEANVVTQGESTVRNASRRTTNVQVFLRMRPTPEPAKLLEVRGENRNILVIRLPRREEDGVVALIDNSRQEHTFYFDAIFPMSTSQEDVFEKAAVPVLEDLMKGTTDTRVSTLRQRRRGADTSLRYVSGVNGTIFAYGQTGTGKTFTITGGAECYKDRGLIPRALTFVFDKVKEDGFTHYNVAVSYLEIYQERGYDLLTTAYGDARRIEDLQKASGEGRPRILHANVRHGIRLSHLIGDYYGDCE
ncbi:UNVERIFIED_CONTAM: hypothetical protein H355_007670 [Colinus virginianus]|nr:hypothetical protein H355_007670 [Colinus virginianus]